jgi:glycogen operon protein
VRSFLRGDEGFVPALADRLLGSPQIYGHKEREAEASVNFATCHDGFTLNDLVSYNQKHNEANGEDNGDGSNDNRSYNCGAEGPTDDPAVETLRNRQVKNFLTLTMVSLGLPMILMGDEARRTQGGNNNAYCQDNETSWFDWTLVSRHADVVRLVRLLCEHRLLADLGLEQGHPNLNQLLRAADRTWHGVKLGQPDWSFSSHSVAMYAQARNEKLCLYLILNAYWESLEFELPPVSAETPWRRWIDTSLESPDDIIEWRAALPVATPTYRAGPRSVIALYARA